MKKQRAQGIWNNLWEEYKAEWKTLWEQYKTIIGPFVKGTFAYAWKIVSGIIAILYNGIYGTGKVILNWLLEIIRKA